MREYMLTLGVAAAITYLLTPLVRRFAVAIGALPQVRDRDVHAVPTPRLGGLAMYGGLAAALLVASQLTHMRQVFAGSRDGASLLLAAGLIVATGFVDDRWGMSATSKLAAQVAAGGILIWGGVELAWIPLPKGGVLSLSPRQGIALTILLVVATINAVNFIDGLDGLAAGVVGIAAFAFFIYSYELTRVDGLSHQSLPALVSAVLAGVCLGFLPHNFYPARIFMGDTGAMLIGLVLAYATISSTAWLDPAALEGGINRFPLVLPLLMPVAILVIPYADLLLAVIRRARAGLSVFAPDREHLHHRLLNIGHSHRLSVVILYLWAGLFAFTVVMLSIVGSALAVLSVATLGGVVALLLVSMPWLRARRLLEIRRESRARHARHPVQPRLAPRPDAVAGGVDAGSGGVDAVAGSGANVVTGSGANVATGPGAGVVTGPGADAAHLPLAAPPGTPPLPPHGGFLSPEPLQAGPQGNGLPPQAGAVGDQDRRSTSADSAHGYLR